MKIGCLRQVETDKEEEACEEARERNGKQHLLLTYIVRDEPMTEVSTAEIKPIERLGDTIELFDISLATNNNTGTYS